MGREDEALRFVESALQEERSHFMLAWFRILRAALLRDPIAARQDFERLADFPDPEGLYMISRSRARAGDVDAAAEMFARAVSNGYFNVPMLKRDPWLEPIRGYPQVVEVMALAEARHQAALATFSDPRGRT